MTEARQEIRRRRLNDVLTGVSVGDGFGQRFLEPDGRAGLAERICPAAPWTVTDDTVLSVALAAHLRRHGEVRQSLLGQDFAAAWAEAPDRGYGASAARLLRAVSAGEDALALAAAQFEGMGSAGNGAAMRAGVVGAFFTEEAELINAARLQAQVTHTHEEAVDGAVAVALATRWAVLRRAERCDQPLLVWVQARLPEGTIRSRLSKASRLLSARDLRTVLSAVGASQSLLSRDTVPFCLWVVARLETRFEEALWACAEAGGDTDTTGAIVGGILGARLGVEGIPESWREATEVAW